LDDGLLQMAFLHDVYLFTHAGVSNSFLIKNGFNFESDLVDDFLNDLFFYKRLSFCFDDGFTSSYTGDDITQSPIWIRVPSLIKDYLKGFTHVIGHTSSEYIVSYKDVFILTDALGCGYYLVLKRGYSIVKNINDFKNEK
jgi:hypothetical protein